MLSKKYLANNFRSELSNFLHVFGIILNHVLWLLSALISHIVYKYLFENVALGFLNTNLFYISIRSGSLTEI